MSKEDFIAHMSGIQRMVLIRGGLSALGSNLIFHDLIVMYV